MSLEGRNRLPNMQLQSRTLSKWCARTAALTLAVSVAAVTGPVVRGASRAPVRAHHGMVASTSPEATRAGLEVLKAGGNAIDAAVAVGFALAVTHPSAGNLGGGGFMVIRLADGRETTIDFRETAPARASRDMFLDARGEVVPRRSLEGPLAAGVPGSVAGLTYALRAYGSRPLHTVMAPAIALARDGFEVSWALSDSLASATGLLARNAAARAALLQADATAPPPGSRLAQPDLARTLTLIAEKGAAAFYEGRIAELVAGEMVRSGGLITREDLAAYRPVERAPVTGTYRGVRVVSVGPPSSGGVALIELLNILEGYPLAEYGANSSRTIHLVAEAARRVYADRAEWLGDPAFTRVPVAGLTAKGYAARLRATIDPARATPSAQVRPGEAADLESTQTTHYSVVDAAGNAVAVTTTLNGGYGNGQMVPGAGFLLNNEMDDFSAKPGTPNMFGLVGGQANAIAPGKRMLSSMTPTILVRDGRAWFVTGSPGGSRIITTVLQTVLNVVDFGMDAQEAVDAPRFHHQWVPDRIDVERRGFPADVLDRLRALGHVVAETSDMGDVHAILVKPDTSLRTGAADPRMDGLALGY
jgi:gamma-glutamyltranspeptidase/glutathione hydrolase